MKSATRILSLLLAMVLLAGSVYAADFTAAGIDDVESVEQFLHTLQSAVKHGDAAAVASLVDFPIKVFVDGRKQVIRTHDAFTTNYAKIMTDAVGKAVLAQEPDTLFVNYQGVMIGNGELWFGLIDHRLRIIAINNAAQ